MTSDPDESAVTETPRPSRQERRARTRAALLDAAERLWAERGIRGASLDEIAARAGLTKGAVYSNFASKAELVLESTDATADRGGVDSERLGGAGEVSCRRRSLQIHQITDLHVGQALQVLLFASHIWVGSRITVERR